MEPVTIKLSRPLEYGSTPLAELVFSREPVTKDIKGIKLSELDLTDNIVTVASRLLGLPPSHLGELPLADFNKVSEVILGFFDSSQKTGKTG